MLDYSKRNAGEFQEKTFGNFFTYRATDNPWALSQGLPFEIDVGTTTRFAEILRTRAYVCVDEDAEGNAVMETWHINKHTVFTGV